MPAENTNFFSSNPEADTNLFECEKTETSAINWRGRDEIVRGLDNIFQFDTYTGFILHGQRQIGKTWFLKKYCEGKEHIYLDATGNWANDVERWKGILSEYSFIGSNAIWMSTLGAANTIYDLFELIFEVSEKIKLYCIVDEFNYLAEDKDFSLGWFKSIIDKHKEHSKLCLILCGSNAGILSGLTSYDQPLYGRFLYSYEMSAISFRESLRWLRTYVDPLDRLKAALICSGMPGLLSLAENYNSFDEFIKHIFRSGIVPVRALTQTLFACERIDYNEVSPITQALAGKSYSIQGLQQDLCNSFDSQSFNKFYKKLRDIRVLEEIPCKYSRHLRNNRRVRLTNMVMPLTAVYDRDRYSMVEALLNRDNSINRLFGSPFEQFCSEFVPSILNLVSPEAGYWEDLIGSARERHEADVVIHDKHSDTVYVVECKFRAKPIDIKAVLDLVNDAQQLDTGKLPVVPVVVSIAGFTSDAKMFAEQKGVLAYSLVDIEAWVS